MPSNPPLTPAVLAELERLLAEAFTARPWSVDPDHRAGGAAQIVRSAHGRLTTTVAFMSTGRFNPSEEDDADAALIVAAVNALPILLASAQWLSLGLCREGRLEAALRYIVSCGDGGVLLPQHAYRKLLGSAVSRAAAALAEGTVQP